MKHAPYRLPAPLLIPLLTLCLGLLACTAKTTDPKPIKDAGPADFIGDWGGDLKTPAGKLALVLHVSEADGALISELDSPDQNAFGIKAQSSTIEEGALVVKIPALKAKIKLRAMDENTLKGKFHQGIGLNLTLTRQAPGQKPAQKARPQTPVPPFAYAVEETSILSGDGTKLAATLTLPKGNGPFATVIMISGSGPQDRDETILGHKPFLVLADALARAGIASLRADDRGVARSEGDFATATEQDFAADARALRAYLKDRVDIRQNRVGYLGHSEGGTIAPMAAGGANDIAFLVLLAGPAKPMGAVILDQVKTFTPNKRALKTALATQEKIYNALRGDKEGEALIAEIKAIIMTAGVDEETAQAQAMTAASPWMRDALDRNAAALIKDLSIPILAIYGSLDTQVPPAKHADLMREALQGGSAQNQVVVLKGLNHLLQPAKTGLPNEYGDIEITMVPEAIALIINWIKNQSED